MKNLLAISGISLFLIGILFKIMHWPGTDIILIFSLGILPIYFLMSMISEWKFENNKLFSVQFFVSIFLTLNGGLFKLMHWPGSDLLLTLGFCSFALYHLIKGFLKIKEGISHLFFGLSFCFLLFGMLFYFMHWPGYTEMEIIALFSALVIVILNITAISKGEPKLEFSNLKGFVTLSVVTGFLILHSLSFIPLSSSLNLIYSFDELQDKNETEILIGNSLSKNKTEINSKIDLETAKIIALIDNVKLSILSYNNDNQSYILSETKENNPLLPLRLNLIRVENKFDQDIPIHAMVGDNLLLDPTKEGVKLWKAYNEYRSKLVNLLGTHVESENQYNLKTMPINEFTSNADLDKQVRAMILGGENKVNDEDIAVLVGIYKLLTKKEFDDYQEAGNVHWIARTFYHTTVTDALRILTQLQNEVLTARTLALSHLSNRK